jgi:minichromosome maintenance protein 10
MVLTLVDLTYEVDLFLFNTGFERFWKLTPGTVLAILNPGILPPPPGREATNRFGLVINSDDDTILEIGNARDIGYCKSIKKDGSYCRSWVNARRTEYCEFHTNEAVRKARTSRIEMSASAGFGFAGSGGSRWKANSRPVAGGDAKSEDQLREERRRGHYDRATQSQYFVSTAHRALADPDDERVTGIADRKEREEGLKRRLIQKEKERDIARRLGELGGGAGREYMSRAATRPITTTTATTTTTTSSSFSSAATSSFTSSAAVPTSSATTSASSFTSTNDPQAAARPKWDARALGLVGRRGADQPKIHLGPPPSTTATRAATAAKRKRPESSGSNATSTVSAVQGAAAGNGNGNGGGKAVPLGWGALLKDKLGRMREGERFDGRGGGSGAGAGVIGTAGAGTTPVLAAPGTNGAGVVVDATRVGGGARGDLGTAATRGDKSPVRKKTRFVTEKGIREAGRESLGEPLSAAVKSRRQVVLDDEDDEDELIILK